MGLRMLGGLEFYKDAALMALPLPYVGGYGTHPGLLPRGELEAEGLGRLHITIRDDLKRTWSRDTRLEHANKKLEGVSTPQLTGKYAKK